MTGPNDIKTTSMGMNLRALVIDEDATVLTLTTQALAERGFKCVTCRTTDEARKLLAGKPFQVVVADPFMSGHGGCRLLTELLEQEHRPIVAVMTAGLDPRVESELRKRGLDEIALQPVDFARLADRLYKLALRRPHAGGVGLTQEASADDEVPEQAAVQESAQEMVEEQLAQTDTLAADDTFDVTASMEASEPQSQTDEDVEVQPIASAIDNGASIAPQDFERAIAERVVGNGRARFSGKAILVGLASLVLLLGTGYGMWQRNAKRRAAEVIEAIERFGGRLRTNEGDGILVRVLPNADLALVDLLPKVPGITTLNFHGSKLTDHHISTIAQLRNLVVLDMSQTKVTDESLRQLKRLTSLRYLHLDHTRITGAGLANLTRLPALEVVSVTGTSVNDEVLTWLLEQKPKLAIRK